MLMQLARSGKSFLAIMLQAGQQEVAMKGIFSGTSAMKSSASSMVHRSAPMATSTVSSKPSWVMAAGSFSGVRPGNWFRKAGATMACTLSPRFMA